MSLSVVDIYKVGIGPSSSHTVGPMLAAGRFLRDLETALAEAGSRERLAKVKVELFGSLALTGVGHGTDKAVILGLLGHHPEHVEVDQVEAILEEVQSSRSLALPRLGSLAFDRRRDLKFVRRFLKYHPNGLRFYAYLRESSGGSVQDAPFLACTYYSVGGGFVVSEDIAARDSIDDPDSAVDQPSSPSLPFPLKSGAALLEYCKGHQLSIAEVMYANESSFRERTDTDAFCDRIWQVMQACIERGFQQDGHLPGHLKVRRRAPSVYKDLTARLERGLSDPLTTMDWVNLYALSVNEENAAGGRVVTAPTNGAAGILPAVLRYYDRFCTGSAAPKQAAQGIRDFLLTSAAIAMLYAENASLSGAEVGCQGEVGVACSMAAAGLTAALGGTPEQVEQAAEIGMEHNLGLTCDPVGGLVQVPCIERNAMGAIKAINAARLALRGDGTHLVSLDSVIETMRQTGADMKSKYKETSRGGLAVAVNISAC